MIKLVLVNPRMPLHIDLLYDLLSERTPEQSISHKEMPSYDEHIEFVKSNPYLCWYLISAEGGTAGSIYLTRDSEIGIFIFKTHQGKGYAREAIKELMTRHSPPFYANVNPANTASQKLFSDLGFNMIQYTYAIGEDDVE